MTVNERNDVHAFRLPAGTGPLFAAIKNDERARIKETPVWPAGSNPKVTLRAVTDYVPTMGRRRPCPRAPVHAGASAPAGRVRPVVA